MCQHLGNCGIKVFLVYSFKKDLNYTTHEASVAKVDEPSQADGGVLGKTKAARMSSQ